MPLAGASAEAIQAELDRAKSRAESGDLDGALADYRELLTRVPALTSIQLQIGALCERRQDTEGALAAYRKLLESDPENVRARQAVERLARR
jgi:tetratricopeptide (TPR) repeat protein